MVALMVLASLRNKKLNDIFLDLRKLLQESSVPTKKDKVNILKNTTEHIQHLQQSLKSAQDWLSHQLQDSKRTDLSEASTPSIFENMYRKTRVAFLLLDLDGHIRDCNPMCSHLFHLPEHALRTASFYQFVHPRELPDIYRAFAELLSSPHVSIHSMKKSLMINSQIAVFTLSMWLISTGAGDPSLIQVMILPSDSIPLQTLANPSPSL